MERRQINFLNSDPGLEKPQQNARKRLWPFFIAGIIFLVLISFGYTAMPEESSNNPADYNPVTLEPKKPESILRRIGQAVFSKERPLEGEKNDRVNVLLLGMGGLGHDGPYLTDTIMIASLKPSTRQVALISIPRDLYVKIPNAGLMKINNANSIGEIKKTGWGAAFAAEVIEDTLDIDIHYYARIDFKAFAEIIDEVDGITINVERSFTDHMYPAPKDEYQIVSFKQGQEKMNGERALKYARSRHGSNGEGSDFARARRQQKMLLALKEKAMSFGTLTNPIRIHDIIKSVDTHLTTNMEFADMMALLKLGRELDQTGNVVTLVLDTSPNGFLKSGYTTDGAFILQPVEENFNRINAAISNIFTDGGLEKIADTPSQKKPEISFAETEIEIQNGTWSLGMAARMKDRLEDRKFTVGEIGNALIRPQPSSGIYSLSDAPKTDVLNALSAELRIPVKDSLPSGVTFATSSDILIILGEDAKE